MNDGWKDTVGWASLMAIIAFVVWGLIALANSVEADRQADCKEFLKVRPEKPSDEWLRAYARLCGRT